MIKFHLPDFYGFYSIYQGLAELMTAHPEYFIDNCSIGSIYGCFPGQIWNGGRAISLEQTTISNIENTINGINQLGIPIRFTYTNCLLEEHHLDDLYCNIVTQIASKSKMNEILFNRPIVIDYLQKKYDGFEYIVSTTLQMRDINKINELIDSDKYKMVVISYNDNKNLDFLKQIHNKKKVEILLNPSCVLNCPKMLKHYEIISKSMLSIPPTLEEQNFVCAGKPCYVFDDVLANKAVIHKEELSQYIDLGFENFKIEGRTNHYSMVIDAIAYYLAKDKYCNLVRSMLLLTY